MISLIAIDSHSFFCDCFVLALVDEFFLVWVAFVLSFDSECLPPKPCWYLSLRIAEANTTFVAFCLVFA